MDIMEILIQVIVHYVIANVHRVMDQQIQTVLLVLLTTIITQI